MKNLRVFRFHSNHHLKSLSDETGSLVILSFSFFLLLLVSALAIVNISDSFLAKRQLVEIGEVAITRAAHSISLSRYYAGNILMDTSGPDGTEFRIPLDCNVAQGAFHDEISTSALRGQGISITSWSCFNDEVEATIEAQIPVLIPLPLGMVPRPRLSLPLSGQPQSLVALEDEQRTATSIIGGARG